MSDYFCNAVQRLKLWHAIRTVQHEEAPSSRVTGLFWVGREDRSGEARCLCTHGMQVASPYECTIFSLSNEPSTATNRQWAFEPSRSACTVAIHVYNDTSTCEFNWIYFNSRCPLQLYLFVTSQVWILQLKFTQNCFSVLVPCVCAVRQTWSDFVTLFIAIL